MRKELALAAGLPLVALVLQWLLWPWLAPFVWFLFYPAVFFSARYAGLRGAIVGTALSMALVWYFFIPRQPSWTLDSLPILFSVLLFAVMGYLFGASQERLRSAGRKLTQALEHSQADKDRVAQLYRQGVDMDHFRRRFVADLGHELRTPLALIMGPLLQRVDLPDPDTQRGQEDAMMLRNARLLYRQLSDLLDIASLDASKLPVLYSRFDLVARVQAMAAQFDALARERAIAYRVDAPARLSIEADAEKVQRIVLNLLTNAFAFAPAGGKVALHLAQQSGQAVLEVQDNGPTVTPDDPQALFHRLREPVAGTAGNAAGIGLGLTVVKEFARQHGGSALARAMPEGGALFVVALPLQAPQDSDIRPEPSTIDAAFEHSPIDDLPAVAGPDPHPDRDLPLVLVIEQNRDMNAYIAGILHPRYRVACAFSQTEGVSMALLEEPDLIVSDLALPELDGANPVEELRDQWQLAEVPILLLTAGPDDARRARLIGSSIQDCLGKPFAASELLARVGRLVSARRQAQIDMRRYEQIVATSGILITFVDRQYRFLLVSPAYASLFGATPAEIRNRLVVDVIGSENFARIQTRIDRALAGEPQHFIAERTYPGGRRRVMEADYQPFKPDSEVLGAVISLRDITEREASADALEASERRLQLALDATKDGLWDWDLQTGVVYRSPR